MPVNPNKTLCGNAIERFSKKSVKKLYINMCLYETYSHLLVKNSYLYVENHKKRESRVHRNAQPICFPVFGPRSSSNLFLHYRAIRKRKTYVCFLLKRIFLLQNDPLLKKQGVHISFILCTLTPWNYWQSLRNWSIIET